jgi:hypothetical protein
MASVVLNGSVSGSCTITAPSAAGTTTLTLPTTSGTVLTTNGSGIASVNGIQFPATQSASADANCLDDYEEGSWTPTLGGNTTYQSGGQVGSYIKIGQFVAAYFQISVNLIGTGSATTVSGLPFTIQNNKASYSGGSIGYFTGINTAVTWIAPQPQINTTTTAFAGAVGAQVNISNVISVFGNSTVFYGCVFYKSTS